jgi:hypothetical protein
MGLDIVLTDPNNRDSISDCFDAIENHIFLRARQYRRVTESVNDVIRKTLGDRDRWPEGVCIFNDFNWGFPLDLSEGWWKTEHIEAIINDIKPLIEKLRIEDSEVENFFRGLELALEYGRWIRFSW